MWTGADLVSQSRQEMTGRVFRDRRRVHVKAPAESIYAEVASLGGDNGWYYANWLWRLRGFVDELLGGVGLRRGRTNIGTVEIGDTIDCWRVEDCAKNSLLVLRAEMKVWGDAWLKFRIEPGDDSDSVLAQTAEYRPSGLFGYLYWYSVYPIHALIFRGMARALGRRAEARQEPLR